MPNGSFASSTDPATWSDYKSVLAALTLPAKGFGFSSPQFDGIGLVLCEVDPFTGIDLDHCLKRGVPNAWAKHIVGALDTYIEITPVAMVCGLSHTPPCRAAVDGSRQTRSKSTIAAAS